MPEFSENAARRIIRGIRKVEQIPVNRRAHRPQLTRFKGGCEKRNEVWQLTVLGSPLGGTFEIDLNVLGITETMTFNWDDFASDVQTELETHTNIGSGYVDVTGGQFPDNTLNIEFIGNLAKTRIPPPLIDFSGLTGGSGVGVVLARYQPGHPKDGSVAP